LVIGHKKNKNEHSEYKEVTFGHLTCEAIVSLGMFGLSKNVLGDEGFQKLEEVIEAALQ